MARLPIMKINLLSSCIRAYDTITESLSSVTYSHVDERLFQVLNLLRDIIKEQREMREELVEDILNRHE